MTNDLSHILIIGVQKTGSTYVHGLPRAHPGIYMVAQTDRNMQRSSLDEDSPTTSAACVASLRDSSKAKVRVRLAGEMNFGSRPRLRTGSVRLVRASRGVV